MKKALLSIFILLLIIAALLTFGWANRTKIVAHLLSNHLHVPVTIGTLDYNKGRVTIDNIWVGNPPASKTNTAFTCAETTIDSIDLGKERLTIDQIEMDTIFLGVEYYNRAETESNWLTIMEKPKEQKKSSRKYLIRTLIFTDFTVAVTDYSGKTKEYPKIKRLEFHNISDETGFPIEEIEKAVFDAALKEAFKQFGIKNLLKGANPNNLLPDFLPQIPLFPQKGG